MVHEQRSGMGQSSFYISGNQVRKLDPFGREMRGDSPDIFIIFGIAPNALITDDDHLILECNAISNATNNKYKAGVRGSVFQ